VKEATWIPWGNEAPEVVSIHAPVKEATVSAGSILLELEESFDPRPREGGDVSALKSVRGAACFDPRPREGGDDTQWILHAVDIVSIHAPVKEAT